MTQQLDSRDVAAVDAELYAGLQAVAAGAFPKHCAVCGRSYRDADDYVAQTQRVGSGRSGLRQTKDDNGQVILELFRNCVCGSTLMDCFNNRRDTSEAGLRRRARFNELVDSLVAKGLERERARAELLNILRGKPSALLCAAACPLVKS
ncbi:oxidoreductase [Aromatoleum anaerobium]|uniref:Oxidoreductase n=2 Tax=Aromatoleum TaxID=551759 RepID=A0ABX1PJX4_9RHOO|nr:oxidoreductase [Aromatoleum anaerobium]MCK0507765.1 oxidoreductase [Aromatoleum anaerobium]